MDIPFPLSTSPGRRPQESAGRLVNCFAEPLGEELGVVWRRSPGAEVFAEIDASGFRGGIEMPGVIYAAYQDEVLAVTEVIDTTDGNYWEGTTHGSLAGSDKLFIARNNNATPDVVVVSPSEGAFVITSEDVLDYPDEDVGSPNAVEFLAGYFFFTYGDGTCRTSGINTTDIDTNDFVTAEQHPDGLIRPQAVRSDMLLCGTESIEVWQNTANPTGFPFSFAYTIPAGLIAPHAMAGGGPAFRDVLVWVAEDNTVRSLSGAEPVKVSPPDLDDLIDRLQDKTELEACVYIAQGHRYFQLSCNSWTRVLNLNNLKWHERDSYLQMRSRLTQTFRGDGKWLCGDTETGNLLHISGTYYQEAGNPLRMRIESGPVKKFPNRMRVPRADFDFTVGPGDARGEEPIETNPVVDISWTDDGGVNWSVPLQRPLGRQQEADKRITVTNTGLTGSQGRRWRLDVSDPVYVALQGGSMSASLKGP